MAKVCTGSQYGNDWNVYTREDAVACTEAGGHVVDSGGDSTCSSTSISSMAAFAGNPSQGVVGALALTPLKLARQQFGQSPLMQALVALNRTAAAEIERLTAADKKLQAEVVAAFAAASGLAAAVTQSSPHGKLEPALFASLEKVGRHIAERSKDQAVQSGIAHVLGLAKPFVGRDFADIARQLAGQQTGGPSQASVELLSPSSVVATAAATLHGLRALTSLGVVGKGPSVGDLLGLVAAEAIIAAKAAALGWAGNPTGDVQVVPGGYRQAYDNADILVGASGVAFEVHGDIRAKYNMLGGPGGILGLPVTDETGTPDGVGRFNHFQNQGSIYWKPNIGPMMVQGRVRDEWANQGWERGPMGYPVHDQQKMPALSPSDHPNLAWCLFENGSLFAIAGAAATALHADITPDQLRTMVRSFFDQKLKAADSSLGLQPQTELLAVSDWTYGFWAASPRMVTIALHGFHDNGPLPDTNFDLQLRLRFSTTWPMAFTYPSALSLVVTLDWLLVHTSGIDPEKLANGLRDGIWGAFWRGGPDPGNPEVPNGAIFLTSIPTGASQTGDGDLIVIDALTTAQGGLQVLLNPLPPAIGSLRQMIAQNQVNAFLGL